MICNKCKKETCIIFITENHEKLCDNCWNKLPQKSEWEIIKEKNERWAKHNN
jgi:hypothetical protein